MIARNANQIAVHVSYGVGESCHGRFARRTVAGLTARQLVARVIECRQPHGTGTRTANVLGEVLRSSREIDVELAAGPGSSAGRPIAFDDVVVEKGEQSDQDEFTLLISESYRGGV